MPLVTEKPTLESWEAKPVGSHVVYVDEKGRSHDALVTAVHGPQTEQQIRDTYQKTVDAGYTPHYSADVMVAAWAVPSINVVYISDDESKRDPYGQQMERASSVSHESGTTAHGRFYR